MEPAAKPAANVIVGEKKVKIALVGLVFAALIGPGIAAEQAKVDFKQTIKNLEGKPFTLCEELDKADQRKCGREVDLTLEKMALAVLQTPEQGLSGTEITRRAYLALRIYEVKVIGLSSEDVKLIKDLVAKGSYNPVAVYRAYEILDPNSVAQK